MKNVLLLVILLVAIGLGWWWYSGDQSEKARIEAAARAKAEQEAQLKAVAAKKAAEERAAAEAELEKQEAVRREAKRLAAEEAQRKANDPATRLAALNKEYQKTDAEWLPSKQQLQQLRSQRGVTPELQTVDPAIKTRAVTCLQRIKENAAQLAECKSSIDKAKANIRRVDTGLSGGGRKKDKYSGWYYVDYPNVVYSMDQLGGRNKKRRIAYVSKKEEVKAAKIDGINDELKKLFEMQMRLQERKTQLENQYADLQTRYVDGVDAQIKTLLSRSAKVLDKRKELRTQMMALQKEVPTQVALVQPAITDEE